MTSLEKIFSSSFGNNNNNNNNNNKKNEMYYCKQNHRLSKLIEKYEQYKNKYENNIEKV